ncbi:hypothetical protein VTK73DRAFT_5277 [Phialemonium thermophilum]|uniref:Nucleotide exchange factor SIL1 n=1 Tax=Phialemonium thermophilum TaxID=223376 RepID=A0ABR3WPB8_9PEZI
MAPGRAWFSPRAVFFLVALLFFGAFAAAATGSPSSPSPSPTPSTDVELICHTDDPAECYPKVFQPTDEFQIVHDDQDLPPGLHVRLNVWTGQKEAKINVPGEEDAALEGLPVDSSVVVVEPEKQQEPQEEPRIPPGAPAYDAAGKIKKPSHESQEFYDSLAFLSKGLNLDEALETLEDISHDIYYGLKIAEDYDTVEALFCLATGGGGSDGGENSAQHRTRARMAALTIAGAVQNNAKALAEIEKHWATLRTLACPATSENLGTATFRLLKASSKEGGAPSAADDGSDDAGVAKARASAIKGLIRSPVIRRDFLDNGGMSLLLDVLVEQTHPEWDSAREKVALLVQDSFLDEDMGAALGEWPSGDQASDGGLCGKDGEDASDKCWDRELERLARHHRSDKGHWSGELWRMLKEAKKTGETQSRGKDEL